MEIVDESGRLVADGTPGEVVVTALTNRAMPLIRYATEDRAVRLSGRCPCGRGLERLAEVQGRVVDYLSIPSLGCVSPYELTTALSTQPDVMQFKLILRSGNRLEVLLVLRRGATSKQTQLSIQRLIKEKTRHAIEVQVQLVESIPRDASGKHRAVEIHTSASRAVS